MGVASTAAPYMEVRVASTAALHMEVRVASTAAPYTCMSPLACTAQHTIVCGCSASSDGNATVDVDAVPGDVKRRRVESQVLDQTRHLLGLPKTAGRDVLHHAIHLRSPRGGCG